MKTSKICFIVIWFGKLPNYFEVWLKGAEKNSTIDFLLFTDQETEYTLPGNVRKYITTLEEIKHRIQGMFDFEICLDVPYKLCDFRPAYGEIFEEYLQGYDFWGHCDLDMIFGDIRHFVTEELLSGGYDRIYKNGPCSLYRNNSEVNAFYRTLNSGGGHKIIRQFFPVLRHGGTMRLQGMQEVVL